MIQIATGNRLDVALDYDDDKKTIKGLLRIDTQELIPLPNPKGLADAIYHAIQQIEEATIGDMN